MLSRGACVAICVENFRIVSRSAHRSDETDARREVRRFFVDPTVPQVSFKRHLALATPCAHVLGRYSGPRKFKARVSNPWSSDIGSSTSAAQTLLNTIIGRRKARPFGLSAELRLQENGQPSPKGTSLLPGPCSMN
jgi:hypothetical protein